MSRKTLLGIVTLVCLMTALASQQSTLAGLRVRNLALRANKAEADRLVVENQDLPALGAANRQPGDSADKELLRLRNEVRQLRAQQPQIDHLRAENERLAAAIKGGAAQPQKLSEMEGFMAKESWSNVGFATPDSALQTFLWAIREGDLTVLAQSVPPEARQEFTRLNEPGNEQERDRTLGEYRRLISGAGLRIAGQESTKEDRATVSLQAATGGAIIKFQLRRYGDEWKFYGL